MAQSFFARFQKRRNFNQMNQSRFSVWINISAIIYTTECSSYDPLMQNYVSRNSDVRII